MNVQSVEVAAVVVEVAAVVKRVEAAINAVDDAHEETRYCREGACQVCEILGTINDALAGES